MKVSEIVWLEETRDNGILFTAKLVVVYQGELTQLGRITVLDRLTGFGGCCIRDVETGYLGTNGKFWLASGNFDIRKYPDLTIEDAIELIKRNANTCKGVICI